MNGYSCRDDRLCTDPVRGHLDPVLDWGLHKMVTAWRVAALVNYFQSCCRSRVAAGDRGR